MNPMPPFPPPILWCDDCGQKRVTWDDRICGSCHATNDTQLEQMLAEGA